MTKTEAIALGQIQSRIFVLRSQRVLLDSDLARFYGVPTKRLNEALKRNADRFPEDFCLRLNHEEVESLTSQIAMSKIGRGGRRTLPWAFTEHGCLMAATVLNSPRAVQMSLFIVRAFVQMREALAANATILKRLAEIDQSLLEHDGALRAIWHQLQPLLQPPPEPLKRRIGFLS